MVAVKCLAELSLDQEIMGSIPAPSKCSSREPAILKYVWCLPPQKKIRELKNNLSYVAVYGLTSMVLGRKIT